jgi:hypothetical protein
MSYLDVGTSPRGIPYGPDVLCEHPAGVRRRLPEICRRRSEVAPKVVERQGAMY